MAAALQMIVPILCEPQQFASHSTGKRPRPESGKLAARRSELPLDTAGEAPARLSAQGKHKSQFYNILEKTGQTAAFNRLLDCRCVSPLCKGTSLAVFVAVFVLDKIWEARAPRFDYPDFCVSRWVFPMDPHEAPAVGVDWPRGPSYSATKRFYDLASISQTAGSTIREGVFAKLTADDKMQASSQTN